MCNLYSIACLQDLLYAKCISEDEYHSFKKPLLQRIAVQGAQIETGNVESSDGEWSIIDLKDESCLLNSNKSNSNSNPKSAASLFGFKSKDAVSKNELGLSKENPFWNIDISEKESKNGSILMAQSSPPPEKMSERQKGKQKSFKTMFQKWKMSDSEDETAPLPLSEKSDSPAFSHTNKLGPLFVGPDTKQIKMKLHSNGSSSDFFVDKVLGDNVKKELRRIQAELSATNANLHFSNDQLEAISTQLPVDKTDLKKFFPKSWCDQYGEVVLDVVKKEFKNHVSEMGNLQNSGNTNIEKKKKKEKDNNGGFKKWTTFEGNEENSHPNIAAAAPSYNNNRKLDKRCFFKNSNNNNNPFLQDYDDHHEEKESHLHDHNPFWTPPPRSHGSSMIN
ncbi:MATH and LRR domain-containing protein PFE0570w-like [Impatiens glandulifera]|uniref:MATH and LRR domain-containing protein PFE0570w-like n=1 Tax=Impatiens glandulifera TaxID=253017 RepID=UPI001FB1869F|nr:MATH and LRR domain-containing protein PFE0570w-like [Impatiens glandulifera]